MSSAAFTKDNLARVYLLYGEDAYKKRYYRDSLRKLVTAGNDMNFASFEGASIDFSAVYDSVVTMPFFAEKRLVIVENSGKFKGKQQGDAAGETPDTGSDQLLLKILEDLPETTCLVFLEETVAKNKKGYKKIASMGQVIECGADTEEDVIAWLRKGFAASGKTISNKAAALLVRRVGTDHDKLHREYEKLIGFSGNRTEITPEDILAISSEDVESRIFDLLGAMGRKDVKGVLAKYQDLLTNREHPLYILAMLRIQFRMLLEVAELRNKGYTTKEVARKLKKQEFVIRNAEGYLHGGFRMKDVRDILEEIANTDCRIKSGDLHEQTGVELLLIKFST